MTYELHHARFQDVFEAHDKHLDAIVTDPPYARKHAHLTIDLVRLAARVLAPGGSLVVLTGNLLLPTLLREIEASGLRYRWTFAELMSRNRTGILLGPRVAWSWKPVVLATQGVTEPRPMVMRDTFQPPTPPKGKTLDAWAQGGVWANWMLDIAGVGTGHVVCDPMMGLGYVVQAAHERGAHAIGIDIQADLVSAVGDWIGAHAGEEPRG